MNIGISKDQNWTNAAIALYNCMDFWRKDPSETWYFDSDLRGGPIVKQVRIGRLIMDWEKMEISLDNTTELGYDGGQSNDFDKLKDSFDRIKKIPAFL